MFTLLFLEMCINKIPCQPIAYINCKSWNKILEVKNKGIVLLMEAGKLRSSVSCFSVEVKHACLYGSPLCLQSSSILHIRMTVKAAISLYSTYQIQYTLLKKTMGPLFNLPHTNSLMFSQATGNWPFPNFRTWLSCKLYSSAGLAVRSFLRLYETRISQLVFIH